MIRYLKGDATIPQAHGSKIIAHVCNDQGTWGRGFYVQLSKRWTLPEQEYRKWHRDLSRKDFALGNVQFVQVGSYIHVANMIAFHGSHAGGEAHGMHYEALERCLNTLRERALVMGASIHVQRNGLILIGGKWELILPILEQTLSNPMVPVYIYDLA